MSTQVAFLGTGLMGGPMATNLLKAGFSVTVWNRTRSKAEALEAHGATVADSPVDAVENADYILSILDSGPVVKEVFFDSGATERMKRGAVFIDMASIPPSMAREHAERLAEIGVAHIDAPVSGGSLGAAEASLAIMAGGDKAAFERAEADGIFKPMGRTTHVGPAGSGQLVKLSNQVMVAVNITGVAQALLLASAGGADPAQIPVALAGGHGDSRTLQEHGQRMLERRFIPGAPMRNFIKDIDTCLAEAKALGMSLPVLEKAAEFYRELYDEGKTQWDHSAWLLALERHSDGVRMGDAPDVGPDD
ncbi:NAD(P)-dependent oxidoreductase [Halomonas sp. ML-15]|uniref:NAD(P)-dependent oxidoreductase n=1 Tax=Halomonas sp. ML-15 TaxID=2773305 RepID=UPI001746CFB4|nr:NAD(P)-dependent oxidoreductase [Halomonas sp. ML-15]MBD3896353.1 NAD(P)-dependent oxidoreductase [Halomonas sp. ML-15]